MEIGERIRHVRMHKGLSQRELVSEICSITYLSRIESGKIKPSSSFIKKVSKKLDVDSYYLINGNYEEIKITIFKICNKYKKDKSITEADLSLLELYVREVDSIPLLLKGYGVLIYYHARQKNMLYVKSLIDQASLMIPSQVETQDLEDYIYYLKLEVYIFIINKTTVLLMIFMYRLRVYLVQKKLNNTVIYTIIYVMYIRNFIKIKVLVVCMP
ncbi:hypothetical protein BAAL111456_18950 [Bacillus albus]